VKELTSVLEKL